MIERNKPIMTLIGFDFGTKSIGIAYGQMITKTAKPLTTLKAIDGTPTWNEIQKIIKEWLPDALVVGMPYNMDGTSSDISKEAKKFGTLLKEKFKRPVYFMDERLTTREARAQLLENKGLKHLTKKAIDAASAKVILESFMNS